MDLINQVIYQTDTCRIFHVNNARVFEEIKDEMEKSECWRLVHEAMINDCNFYLIYWIV